MQDIQLSIRLKRITSIILLILFLPILITAQEIEQIENLNNKEESIWIENEQASKISADGFSDDGAMAYINGIYAKNKNNLAKVFHLNISDPGKYFLSVLHSGIIHRLKMGLCI